MDEIFLTKSRGKFLFVLIGSLALVLVAIWLLTEPESHDANLAIIALSGVFFGFCAFVALLVLLSDNSLRITESGFDLKHFGRTHSYSWSECGEFSVWNMIVAKFVVFNSTSQQRRGLALLDKLLTGRNDGLPDTFGMSARKLAALLNERRAAALANS